MRGQSGWLTISLFTVDSVDQAEDHLFFGANGSGKSTLFTVFAFLREAMASNVNTALSKLAGSNGFDEARSRDSKGQIEIELKFREQSNSPLVTYFLSIDQDSKSNRAYITHSAVR